MTRSSCLGQAWAWPSMPCLAATSSSWRTCLTHMPSSPPLTSRSYPLLETLRHVSSCAPWGHKGARRCVTPCSTRLAAVGCRSDNRQQPAQQHTHAPPSPAAASDRGLHSQSRSGNLLVDTWGAPFPTGGSSAPQKRDACNLSCYLKAYVAAIHQHPPASAAAHFTHPRHPMPLTHPPMCPLHLCPHPPTHALLCRAPPPTPPPRPHTPAERFWVQFDVDPSTSLRHLQLLTPDLTPSGWPASYFPKYRLPAFCGSPTISDVAGRVYAEWEEGQEAREQEFACR